MTVVEAGALAFGAVIGWNLYLINRYRSGDVKIGDLVTLIGAIGGAAILAIFPAASDLFGWYGVGLAVGFFAYFVVLLMMVAASGNRFDVTWFLDGRRKDPGAGWVIPAGTAETLRAMDATDGKKPV